MSKNREARNDLRDIILQRLEILDGPSFEAEKRFEFGLLFPKLEIDPAFVAQLGEDRITIMRDMSDFSLGYVGKLIVESPEGKYTFKDRPFFGGRVISAAYKDIAEKYRAHKRQQDSEGLARVAERHSF